MSLHWDSRGGVRWRTDNVHVALLKTTMTIEMRQPKRDGIYSLEGRTRLTIRYRAWAYVARCKTIRVLAAIFTVLTVLAPASSLAQAVTLDLPENASADRYGGSWVCDRGFRKSDGTCVAIVLPNHAYPTGRASGRGWECRRGFREHDGACTTIAVPEHAFLVSRRGGTWKCARGYIKVDETCKPIDVPAHAFLSASTFGSGWECERGYQANSNRCVELAVPKNAHINYSGHEWECDLPYRKDGESCTLR